MHFVDRIGEGEFTGWISGGADGRPSYVDLSYLDQRIEVLAVGERVDVFRAGFTLYSGFNFIISSFSQDNSCRAYLEKKEYEILPSLMNDKDLLRIDDSGRDYISGWINLTSNLRSLSFFSVSGMVRAEVHMRSDINGILNTPADRIHGFYAQGLDVSKIFAININNVRIHWLSPGWLT